ncbi:hypothetical protein HaLaN_31831 [Haematococcus lacustris]|uniref:Uncharacterized protein n=1 Tax=Haematococcus lacustris TaxID=44745 RepID=A0A6A0AIL2_HAELA|nr:hypothetical protein HaLaN_31831 [Haematococcus lacustris]
MANGEEERGAGGKARRTPRSSGRTSGAGNTGLFGILRSPLRAAAQAVKKVMNSPHNDAGG